MRKLKFLISVGLIGAAAGCEHGPNSDGVAATASLEPAMRRLEDAGTRTEPLPKSTPRPRGPTRPLGLPGLFFGAARRLGLTEAVEATIAQSERRLEGASDAQEQAWNSFRADLAMSLRAGAVDTARLRADEQRVEGAMVAMRQEQFEAFRTLHAVLTYDQRKLVAGMTRESAALPSRRTPQFHEVAEGTIVKPKSAMMEFLKTELSLDSAQVQKLADNVAKLDKPVRPELAVARAESAKKQLTDLLDALEAVHFDAKAVDLTPIGATPMESMEREASLVMYLLPILRADQAERYARTLVQQ